MTVEEFQNQFSEVMAEAIVAGALRRGDYADVLLMTEKVLARIGVRCIELGGDELVLDLICNGARRRLDKLCPA
jgi:hypothetical protein